MNTQNDCAIFFNHTPTVSQIAEVFHTTSGGLSSLIKLTNDLAEHYINKLEDRTISKEGLSKAIAIKMLQEGIHYTVTKLDKLNTKPQSKFFYKKKIPHYSLVTSDIKNKAEGRKMRF